MSYIPLTEKRMNDTYSYAQAYPVDDTDYDVQLRRDTEMAEFLIELICEYSVGSVYGETDVRCVTNFTQDIHRYADRYRCDRYQFIKNDQFIRDLHNSYECKRQTVLQCNLFINGFIVFEDFIEFVNEWGANVVCKVANCEKTVIEMTEIK
jgi:hypothetical protein